MTAENDGEALTEIPPEIIAQELEKIALAELFDFSFLEEEFKKFYDELEAKTPVKYRLSDLFEPITVKRFNLYKSEEGEIPLFGATNKNKPVKFIKNISYTVTEEEKGQIVTINKNGSAGYCFRKDLGAFSITHDVNCYRLKKPLTDEDLDTITIQLNKLFDFHHNLNAKRFKETFVYLFE